MLLAKIADWHFVTHNGLEHPMIDQPPYNENALSTCYMCANDWFQKEKRMKHFCISVGLLLNLAREFI